MRGKGSSAYLLPSPSRSPFRVVLQPASDTEWRDDQLPREWVPEKRPSMVKHMAKVRDRLKR